MFDLGTDEILLTVIVAVVAIGPKELPRALRMAGRWTGKARRMSSAFRAGIDTMMRESEISELEENWSAGRNEVQAHFERQEREARLIQVIEAEPKLDPQPSETVPSGHDPITVRSDAAR